jgi:hypothetical protein
MTFKDRIGIDLGRSIELEDGIAWAAKNGVYYFDAQTDIASTPLPEPQRPGHNSWATPRAPRVVRRWSSFRSIAGALLGLRLTLGVHIRSPR